MSEFFDGVVIGAFVAFGVMIIVGLIFYFWYKNVESAMDEEVDEKTHGTDFPTINRPSKWTN